MASKFFERRAVRNQLKVFLEAHNWLNLNWSEGFSDYTLETVVPPFIAIHLDDLGKNDLEMGSDPSINKMFTRRIQADVFMEDENRVNAITDDIADFFDLEVIVVKDNTSAVLGTMISDTESIISETELPDLTGETNLRWAGSIVCMYETHYPSG
jgi:hypothetical protein